MYKNSARHKTKHDYDLQADLEKIKDAFGDTARDVRGKASDIIAQSIERARERSFEMQDGVVNYIQDKPIKAVGIAAFVGMIFGLWLRRR